MFRITQIITVIIFSLYSLSLTAAEKKEWTFLVFLNADNNLEGAGYDDIQEMEKFGSNEDVNVVVQFDGYDPLGTQRIYVEKNTGTPATGNTFNSPVLEDMPEQDMGSTDTFVDFVTWGMENYPAEHYFVILWNHGSGWSKEQSILTKSISYDDTSGNYIRTNELAGALDEIVAQTGKTIDVLGFDACLMGMYEVADSLVGMVDYLVASEEVEPWDGYAYDDLLRAFYARSDKSIEALLIDSVQEYGKSYSSGSQGYQQVTQSALDLSKLALVKRRLNEWVEAVSPKVEAETLRTAGRSAVTYYDSHYRDLGDYVKGVLDAAVSAEPNDVSSTRVIASMERGVVGSSMALLNAIDEMVVSNFNSPRYEDSTGIAIYLPFGWGNYSPWSNPNSSRRLDYFELDWAQTTNWTDHLDLLFPPY